jgi:phosphatidylglycerophosphate synthase
MGHRETTSTLAAAAQVALLAALVLLHGLGSLGLLAGAVYGAALLVLLTGAMRRAGRSSFGPADLVTLGRALLVGGVTALVVDGLVTGVTATLPLVVCASVALALDAVDGQVARRTGTVSKVGARFDMEVDAFLILVLSVHVAGLVGRWALTIGAMRYAFVAAGWALPWLRGSLPASYATKAVAALQGVVLVAAVVVAHPLAVVLVAVGLALLCWSFGRDALHLWTGRAERNIEPIASAVRMMHVTTRRVAVCVPTRRRDVSDVGLRRARRRHADVRHPAPR